MLIICVCVKNIYCPILAASQYYPVLSSLKLDKDNKRGRINPLYLNQNGHSN